MGCCNGEPIRPPPPGTPLNEDEARLRNKLRSLSQLASELWESVIRNPGKHCEICLHNIHERVDMINQLFGYLKESIDDHSVRRQEASVFPGDADARRSETGGDEGSPIAGSQSTY